MFSFSSTLDRLRQKPEAVRTRYLFFSIGVSFIFVVALWAFSLRASISAISGDETTDAIMDNVHNITESAPASLEDLMKAGKTLEEKGVGLGTADSSPSPRNAPESSSENQGPIPAQPPNSTESMTPLAPDQDTSKTQADTTTETKESPPETHPSDTAPILPKSFDKNPQTKP